MTGAFGGNKSSSSSSSCSRPPFSLHRVRNEACSSIITYSFHPCQGLSWSWRPFDTLHSVPGIFPSAIVAESFYPVLTVITCFTLFSLLFCYLYYRLHLKYGLSSAETNRFRNTSCKSVVFHSVSHRTHIVSLRNLKLKIQLQARSIY